jgi:hypothetical protein
MAISNIRFAAKPASPLDPVEDMRTAVGPGYLIFAVRRWDYCHDRLGEGVGAEQKRHPGKSLVADHVHLDHRSVIQSLQRAIPVMAAR